MSESPSPRETQGQGQASSTPSAKRSRAKTDPVWKHATEGPTKGEVICNYCGQKYWGGANRMKYHLAKIPCRDASPCPNVEEEVSRQMVAYLEAYKARAEIRKRTTHELARPPHPSYGAASGSSDETDLLQSHSAIGPRVRYGSLSGSSSSPSSGRGRGLDFFASRSNPGGQPSLEATWNKEKMEEAKMAIANFFYYNDVPFHASRSPYFDYMVNAIAVVGPGMRSPSYHEIRGRLLEKAVTDVNSIIDEQKKIWRKRGCSILSDGWTDARGRTLLNFMVASAGGLTFLRSIDASGHIKNADYLFTLLEGIILEVGPENVVQVITDNATAYVSAGRLIEERFPSIFWTPCAAHCLDLLLEDIGKIDWVKDVIEKAKHITKFIYTHSWVLNLMRTKFTHGKEIVRAGATRFATSFLSLQSFSEAKPALMCMFVAVPEWTTSKYANDPEAIMIKDWLFDGAFSKSIEEILRFAEPLVRVLRLVDGDKSPMGYIYEAMDRAKEAIAGYYGRQQEKYGPLWDIIDRRWTRMIHRPLHAAGYFLNPKFFYSESFEADEEVSSGFQLCVERMHSDVATRDSISDEITIYREAQGYLFASPQAIQGRNHQAPDQWWLNYGAKTPHLQRMATRILSQPCSASGCERNWSTFEHIHSKKRNRLTQQKLNDLVFVHYNLRLRHRQVRGDDPEPIDLDEIHPSDTHADWVSDLQPEDEDMDPIFDFTFEEMEDMEAQAVAMAAEEEQAQAAAAAATQVEETPPITYTRTSNRDKRKLKGKTKI